MKTDIKVVTEPTPEHFAEALGIGTKREEQLCDLIGQCYDSTDTYPLAIAGIAQDVKNITELVYSVFHLGAFAGEERLKQEWLHRLKG